MTVPLMFSSSLHGSRHVTVIHLFLPVLILDFLVADPEPEFQSAGVAQTRPDVGRGGALGFLLDPCLLVTVSDGDQVIVVLSAVREGLLPGLLFFDQDHVFCHGRNEIIIFVQLTVENTEIQCAFFNTDG